MLLTLFTSWWKTKLRWLSTERQKKVVYSTIRPGLRTLLTAESVKEVVEACRL
jgi:hypothetical protein